MEGRNLEQCGDRRKDHEKLGCVTRGRQLGLLDLESFLNRQNGELFFCLFETLEDLDWSETCCGWFV